MQAVWNNFFGSGFQLTFDPLVGNLAWFKEIPFLFSHHFYSSYHGSLVQIRIGFLWMTSFAMHCG